MAQRLHLERLDAEMLAQLKHCQTLPIRVSEQQASRWGCYVFTVDTCKRDVSVVIQSITDAFERLQREACGKTLNYAQAQLLEFREHNQNATSTYPMSIAFPFTSDETIPDPLLEIQLSAYRLAEISLPSPNYIPIIFHHFYQRIFDEQQSYFGGLPAFWRFDETTGQLHHRCQIEPCHLVEADPMWGLFDENHFIELKGTYTAQSHHAIPHSKRAGTRRLSTLIGVLKDKIHDSLVCDIAFQMPVENTDQQYHYTIGNFCSQRGRSEIGKSSYLIEGCHLITQWKGDNVYQLENELERFYIRLSQHSKYQYRAAPELFKQLTINQDSISFELLTPVEKRSASRQKSVWTVDL
ncbi:hypothetical protein JCM19238_141 [Vibrio ponticus]|nr:hypothetical protein JCM19238_141 [Vibrio ponticus]